VLASHSQTYTQIYKICAATPNQVAEIFGVDSDKMYVADRPKVFFYRFGKLDTLTPMLQALSLALSELLAGNITFYLRYVTNLLILSVFSTVTMCSLMYCMSIHFSALFCVLFEVVNVYVNIL
jgi:hypothetical protein